MPSIATQYTPLESLLLFQSIARHGTDQLTFSSISKSLNSNFFIQKHDNYDANRLAPDALKSLYETLIQADRGEIARIRQNGASTDGNPRKRKLSPSPDLSDRADAEASQTSGIVNRLYARYSEHVGREINEQELQFHELSAQIQSLEEQTKTLRSAGTPSQDSRPSPAIQERQIEDNPAALPKNDSVLAARTHAEQVTAQDAKLSEEDVKSRELKPLHHGYGQMLPPKAPTQDSLSPRPMSAGDSRAPSTPGSHHSPAPPVVSPMLGPQPQPQPPRYSHVQSPLVPPATGSPRASHVLPPLSSIILQPPPHKATPGQRKNTGPTTRVSTLLPSPSGQTQHAQPPYGYPYPHPQWPQYGSPNTPYSNQAIYQQPYPRDPGSVPPPFYAPYSPYPQALQPNQYGPSPYPRPPPPSTQTPQYVMYPWQGQPGSAASTPSIRGATPSRIRAFGPTTPWTPGGSRHGSPERPQERDVSPLSERAASPEAAPGERLNAQDSKIASPPKGPPRRGRGRKSRGSRPGSVHSSTVASRSRSQSVLSTASDARNDRVNDAQQSQGTIKREGPSTPAMMTSDNEQRSSGRRRGRSGAKPPAPSESGWNTNKRKHNTLADPSPSPSLPAQRPVRSRGRPRLEAPDPSIVIVSKHFARMANPILNDVNRHKVASIFAKPLTERDAPGYQDLIYRPQDLKSIRAALNRGSRAANIVIEDNEMEDEDGDDGDSPKVKSGPVSGSFLVTKTEDLSPPKGIVNSAQMEMELMRIFANAIMFNPLPASERNLVPKLDAVRDAASASRTESGEEGDVTAFVGEDDGGIIHDTRDMFASVEKAVTQWRNVEQGYFDDMPRSSTGMGIGLRGGSVSMSDVPAEESELDGDELGTTRKRRRLVE